MLRLAIMAVAVLMLGSSAAPAGFSDQADGAFELLLAKKKQNFGSARLNCKNRRTYADYVRCGII